MLCLEKVHFFAISFTSQKVEMNYFSCVKNDFLGKSKGSLKCYAFIEISNKGKEDFGKFFSRSEKDIFLLKNSLKFW